MFLLVVFCARFNTSRGSSVAAESRLNIFAYSVFLSNNLAEIFIGYFLKVSYPFFISQVLEKTSYELIEYRKPMYF